MTFTHSTINATDFFIKSFSKIILAVAIGTSFHYLSWKHFIWEKVLGFFEGFFLFGWSGFF